MFLIDEPAIHNFRLPPVLEEGNGVFVVFLRERSVIFSAGWAGGRLRGKSPAVNLYLPKSTFPYPQARPLICTRLGIRMMFDDQGFGHEDHPFGDVRRMVGDPLQAAANDNQVDRSGNGAGVGHHVGE